MPLNGLNSGIDHKLAFNGVDGSIDFEIIENFSAKQDTQTGKEIAIDGNVRHPQFYQGWSGSFTLQRNSNFVDRYFASQETSYYLGLDQLPVTITETITENDGSVSQWQYTNVVLQYDNSGNWSGTEIVKQAITFMAARRINMDQQAL